MLFLKPDNIPNVTAIALDIAAVMIANTRLFFTAEQIVQKDPDLTK